MAEFVAEFGPSFIWLSVAIVALILEGATCELVSIWFVPGAVIAMILSIFVKELWIQFAVFLFVSVLALVLSKTVFRKFMPQSKLYRSNSDGLIGEHGMVEEEINNLRESGSVRVKALTWTARSTDDGVNIPAGTLVTIREVRGVKLICEPMEQQPEQNQDQAE